MALNGIADLFANIGRRRVSRRQLALNAKVATTNHEQIVQRAIAADIEGKVLWKAQTFTAKLIGGYDDGVVVEHASLPITIRGTERKFGDGSVLVDYYHIKRFEDGCNIGVYGYVETITLRGSKRGVA